MEGLGAAGNAGEVPAGRPVAKRVARWELAAVVDDRRDRVEPVSRGGRPTSPGGVRSHRLLAARPA